jgi:integrase
MASIERRGDAYRTKWRLGGGRNGRWQYCTWHDEGDALKAKLVAERHGHDITDTAVIELILGTQAGAAKGLPSVTAWSAVWLASRTRISPDTRWRYRRQLDTVILPAIGHLPLDQVTGEDVVAILKQLRAEGRSHATATRYFAVLTSMFGYAVKEDKIADNPAERTDWVRDQIEYDDGSDEGDDHCYLTAEEYQLIRDAMAPAGRPVIDLLVQTGMRWSEGTAASVGSVRLDARPRPLIRVHRAWTRDDDRAWILGATKGRTRRPVELSAVGAETVRELVAPGGRRRPDNALLLTAPRGGRLWHHNFAERYWDRAVAAAMRCPEHPPPAPEKGRTGPARRHRSDEVSTCDCPVRLQRRPTIHDLRHTHAAWLIAQGWPIVAISRRLGHRSTAVTEQIYAGILPSVNAAMLDGLDRMLGTSGAADGEAGGPSALVAAAGAGPPAQGRA